GIPVVGMEATGWLNAFLNSETSSKQLEQLPPPKTFHGTLRPYQARGVSWMAFQETLGFGVCLADDMGLGKTIQLLALMAHEREQKVRDVEAARLKNTPASAETDAPLSAEAAADAAALRAARGRVPPTLLVVPMSVVGNW